MNFQLQNNLLMISICINYSSQKKYCDNIFSLFLKDKLITYEEFCT